MNVFSALNKWSTNIAHNLLTDYDGTDAPSARQVVRDTFSVILTGETDLQRRTRTLTIAIEINVISNIVLAAIGILLQPATFIVCFAVGAVFGAVPSLKNHIKKLCAQLKNEVKEMNKVCDSKTKIQVAIISSIFAPVISICLSPVCLGFGAGFAVTEIVSR